MIMCVEPIRKAFCFASMLTERGNIMNRKTSTDTKSKVDVIYDFLLENIGHRKYKQGSKLVISQIAREVGTSEIPVREALRRLESEGYVEIRANQGAFVTERINEKILSVFQIRGVLEGFATRIAIDYMTQEAYNDLDILNRRLELCIQQGTHDLFGRYNMEFHQRIYAQIPQVELRDMITDLWRRWSITKSVFALAFYASQEVLDEHYQIIEMMKNKQYEEVEALVRKHKIRSGVRMHQELLRDVNEQNVTDSLDELLRMPSMQPYL